MATDSDIGPLEPASIGPTHAAPSPPRWSEKDRRRSMKDLSVAELTEELQTRRQRGVLLLDPELHSEPTRFEMWRMKRLARWKRSQEMARERRQLRAAMSAEKRGQRAELAIQRETSVDERWFRRAVAARRRVTSPDARLANLRRQATWSSYALIGVVVIGMAWAAVNVQHGLVPSNNIREPLFWLSYGIEAMISIPLVVVMAYAAAATRWRVKVNVVQIVAFECFLLSVTVALNVVPHALNHDGIRAAESAVPPVMVAVVAWLHAWVSARYGELMTIAFDELTTRLEETDALLVESPAENASRGLAKIAERGRHEFGSVTRSGGIDDDETDTEIEVEPSRDWRAIAEQTIAAGLLPQSRPIEQIAEILYLYHDRHYSQRQTKTAVGLGSHETVGKILSAARAVLTDAA
ncbi:hypothetical protein [Nocardia transvalensis]|uniref:hypothetical protein n=1 Tax=Nocardia transvalensis TaxID=37333 RepID=UPI0018941A84|nr:hypothetical protein [Nocardia transvalensis]MBF6333643.1 hypothetical protein [Nocardia transvalensis]